MSLFDQDKSVACQSFAGWPDAGCMSRLVFITWDASRAGIVAGMAA